MKGVVYEVVNGAIDHVIQSHDNSSMIGFQALADLPASHQHNSSKQQQVVMNLDRIELSDWVEHVTKQLIDDSVSDQSFHADHTTAMAACHHAEEDEEEEEEEDNVTDNNNNNNNIVLMSDLVRPRKVRKRNGHFDSNIEFENQSNVINGVINRGLSKIDDDNEQGLSLITLLLECAVAISVDNLGEAHRMLLELTQMASPYSSSCGERVVAYFAKAMASRVINSWLGICSPLINHKSIHAAFQIFNNVSPFIKFSHFTSNQAILEAFQRRDRVHIIDLDIMQGLQWPALFHILATRNEGPPLIRMTGMGTSMDILVETGQQLSNFAKRLGLSFEFNPIAKKFGEIDLSMIPINRGETIAVNWLQHSLYDATGPDWKTMRLLEQLSPRIITLVEQDIAHGGSFLDRFVSCLHYYSTLFDSLGAFLASDDYSRYTVEHCLFYREINNVLAIGGPARSGEDKFRQWRSEIAARNTSFIQVAMSGNSMAQAQLILNMFPPAHDYRIGHGDGALRLGWKDTSLFTASAWTSLASR